MTKCWLDMEKKKLHLHVFYNNMAFYSVNNLIIMQLTCICIIYKGEKNPQSLQLI